MKFKFFSIQWNNEEGDVDHLPTEVVLDVSEDFDPEIEGADLLSDTFGTLVDAFEFEGDDEEEEEEESDEEE